MIAPILLPAVLFLMILGESFLLFLVSLAISLLIVFSLAKRLETKDAIAYPLVQYPFLVLLFILFKSINPGLGFILILPLVFIINTSIGYLYFRFVKNKKWFTHVLIFLLTLIVTIALYSNDNGKSMFSIIFDKLLN